MLRFGLGGTSKARRQHHIFLLAGKTTGLCRERIIVFTDDVNFLALALRRAAAQRFKLGAVVPVGSSGSALTAGAAGAESRSTGGRWCVGPCDGWGRSAGALSCFGGCIRPPWCRCNRTTHGLLQLHQFARSHGLSHATGHAWASGGTGTCGGAGASTGCGAAVATDRLAHQLERVSSLTHRCAGTAWASRAARSLWNTGAGAPWNRLAHKLRPWRWLGWGPRLGGTARSRWRTGTRSACSRPCRCSGSSHDLWFLTLPGGWATG